MTAEPAPVKDPLWYKDAIIYQLHIKAFFDSSNDGIGDFAGLIEKLDYVKALGVNTIWLLPFYPSPLRDDGYDIADYTDVNPTYGTLDDFKRFVHEAHARDLRVITELVINHTSDQHPWFQAARNAPIGSPERDFYVWSDDDTKFAGTRIIFTDTEKSNWTWDPVAKQYFWHRFFSHQPDLNFDNPAVLEKVIEAMYFWLDMGVDGLRLDAIPYLVEREGTSNENIPETHAIIKKVRAALDARYPDRLLLAEANMWPEDVKEYFGDGDECQMAFHFPVMPRMYMAVAQEDRHPITDIMRQTPEIPENCQWAMFLRNHDELTLEMVTDRERDYMWNFYSADKRARINVGIRRRLAPLMDNDRRKIELLNSLLMSMPGTPIMYYGDEIGMGDNIYLGDRDGVRTPMQWSPDRNGGFSKAEPQRLYLPAIMDPVYGFQSVNVEAQTHIKNSLYNWTKNLIAARKRVNFGRSKLKFLYPANRKILAYLQQYEDQTVLCVANLAGAPQAVELNLPEFAGSLPTEMLSGNVFPAIGTPPYMLTLAPYGFFWFLLDTAQQNNAVPTTLPEWRTLVIPQGWDSLRSGFAHLKLQRDILPGFLMTRRWYKAKDAGLPTVRILHNFTLGQQHLLLIEATAANQAPKNYVLLCGIAWETMEHDPSTLHHKTLLARVRKGPRMGVLYEAFQDAVALSEALDVLLAKKPIQDGAATLNMVDSLPLDVEKIEVQPMDVEQSNSSALVNKQYMFKLVRQPSAGINLEEEITDFLTNTAGFANTPKLLGAAHVKMGDEQLTIGLLQAAVVNQGDGWTVTTEYLKRLLNEPAEQQKDFGYYLKLAKKLGQRTAEMHNALGSNNSLPDFAPESFGPADRQGLIMAAETLAHAARGYLLATLPNLSLAVKAEVEALLADWQQVTDSIQTLLPETIKTPRIRVHGDYHLGQVLVHQNDFVIIDFEGEPARSMAERRQKNLPYKDVAGMLRSFDYAANATLLAEHTHNVEVSDLFHQWSTQTAAVFLKTYLQTAVLEDSAATTHNLIRFYQLEKALYEICYEAQQRPDWLFIPIRGLLAVLRMES